MGLVNTGAVRLHVEEVGSGPPVLLIMGVSAQLTLWPQGLVDRLVDRGFRVIRFDNRDIGLSESLDHVRPPDLLELLRARGTPWRPASIVYDLHDMARDTIGLLDALGLESAHFVGASMGGMIAQICAIEHASRVRTLTSIMSSPGDALSTTGDPRVLRTLLSQRPRTPEQAGASRVLISHAFNGGGLPLDDDELARLGAADFERASNPAGASRQFGAIMASRHRRRTLPSIRCPSHVIHGTHDPMIPLRGGELTAALIPGATMQAVERMGHNMHRLHLDTITEGIAGCVARATPSPPSPPPSPSP